MAALPSVRICVRLIALLAISIRHWPLLAHDQRLNYCLTVLGLASRSFTYCAGAETAADQSTLVSATHTQQAPPIYQPKSRKVHKCVLLSFNQFSLTVPATDIGHQLQDACCNAAAGALHRT